MNLTLSAPSKTFLVGEYGVLHGGPALILNTAPRFELKAVHGSGRLSGIPVGSPAYRWLEERACMLNDWDLEFRDPHAGAGGFGASGAQFLFAHSLTTLLQISVGRALEGLDLKGLVTDFKVLSEGQASGSDLLSQSVGSVAKISEGTSQAYTWPFPELDFAILRTLKKVATHVHLLDLDPSGVKKFVTFAEQSVKAFSEVDAPAFLQSINTFADQLRESGLQAEHSVKITADLRAQDWCLAAKGCGALGADTVILVFKKEDLPKAKEYSSKVGLPFAGSLADLSEGLKMDWSWA